MKEKSLSHSDALTEAQPPLDSEMKEREAKTKEGEAEEEARARAANFVLVPVLIATVETYSTVKMHPAPKRKGYFLCVPTSPRAPLFAAR